MNSAEHAGIRSFCAGMTFGCGTRRRPMATVPCAKADSLPNQPDSHQSKREVSDYVPFRVHSHYSFLDSTLSPTAIVELAKQHGLSAVALTDTGNLHGAVEFVQAAKQAGVKPILGTELRVGDKPLLLYVESARGYHNLCRLLSRHAERTATDGDEASVAAQQRRPFRRERIRRIDGWVDCRQRGRAAGGNVSRPFLSHGHDAQRCRANFPSWRVPQSITPRLTTGRNTTSCKASAR